MMYCTCENCGARLKIDKNDTMLGCREREDVYCPICKEVVTTVFTSGFPTARVVGE